MGACTDDPNLNFDTKGNFWYPKVLSLPDQNQKMLTAVESMSPEEIVAVDNFTRLPEKAQANLIEILRAIIPIAPDENRRWHYDCSPNSQPQ